MAKCGTCKLCPLNYVCLLHALVLLLFSLGLFFSPKDSAPTNGFESNPCCIPILQALGITCLLPTLMEFGIGLFVRDCNLKMFNVVIIIWEVLQSSYSISEVMKGNRPFDVIYLSCLPLLFAVVRIVLLLFCRKCSKSCCDSGKECCKEKEKKEE